MGLGPPARINIAKCGGHSTQRLAFCIDAWSQTGRFQSRSPRMIGRAFSGTTDSWPRHASGGDSRTRRGLENDLRDTTRIAFSVGPRCRIWTDPLDMMPFVPLTRCRESPVSPRHWHAPCKYQDADNSNEQKGVSDDPRSARQARGLSVPTSRPGEGDQRCRRGG